MPRFALMLAIGALFGCGSRPPDPFNRAAVAGEVTLDGAALADGDILFIPLSGGTMAGGKIKGGKYKLARHEGPSVGPNRVEIRSVQPTGRIIESNVTPEGDGAPGDGKVMEHKELVPRRFNNESELKVEVQKGADNSANFRLESPPAGKRAL
jgi:hypothetical protein